jgi:general nucleoside transport system permease protein
MNDSQVVNILASIVFLSVPLMLAILGETITERVGVINLSLDGTMLLTAMAGFVVAFETEKALGPSPADIPDTIPVLAGLFVAGLIGALIALLIAWGGIALKQDQVAIGFVLTLLLAELANFLGQRYTNLRGPRVAHLPIPVLSEIPLIGPLLFDHDLLVYGTLILVFAVWWFMYRTQPGLQLRGIGERPESAFVRGVPVNSLRYLYTALGGFLVGLAGAAFSLDVKLGWSDNHISGMGWIALAIVIFGGWHPLRGAFGALLFGVTKAIANILQTTYPAVPTVLFNSVQWLLMLGVLLLVGSDFTKRLISVLPRPMQAPLARLLRIAPPQALGRTFGQES